MLVCSDPTAPDVPAIVDTLGSLADTTVSTAERAGAVLARLDVDVLVADDDVGAATVQALLSGAARTGNPAVAILLTGAPAEATGARARGLTVLAKPVDPETLRSVCALAMDCAALRRRAGTFDGARVPEPLPHADPPGNGDPLAWYEGLLVQSPAMRAVLETLRDLEPTDVTVLIEGETGTGKELVARAIHARSRRGSGPFVPVNLGALSETLRESDLFGHVRGAFTGAHDARGGFFLAANGGSLFLDEVGEASPALQVALLRVLEERTITPVGADRPRPVDVRIISATNQKLAQLVRDGRFRRDLYYRLNVFPVRLAPLRERVQDVFPLADHFLRCAARTLGREATGISREARLALERHRWDGNVRELRSVMERAALVCRGGLIVAADLPLASDGDDTPPRPVDEDLSPHDATLRDVERRILVQTLALARGNQSHAARILGLHESTLRFRLRRAGIGAPRRAAGS